MGRMLVDSNHPLLEGSFSRKLGKMDLNQQVFTELQNRIETILNAYYMAMASVSSLFDDALEEKRLSGDLRKKSLFDEYNSLVVMVKEDYGRVIGRLDDYRDEILSERDSLLNELATAWNEQNQREDGLANKMYDEMKRALTAYKKELFKYGKDALDDALKEARGHSERPQPNGAN